MIFTKVITKEAEVNTELKDNPDVDKHDNEEEDPVAVLVAAAHVGECGGQGPD